MNRREFFKTGFQKVSKTLVEAADEHVKQKALHWIRPPYALNELEFLLACTRCDKCIEACPHDVIFPLPARRGARVTGTPAMNLLNKGCHLCEDWPCVTACEPGALKRPEADAVTEQIPLPQIALAAVNTQTCLPYHGPECGACASSCPVPNTLLWKEEKPYINTSTCTGCGLCREACIVEPKAINIKSIHYQTSRQSTNTSTLSSAE